MKRISLLIVLVLSSLISFSQENQTKCMSYRTGTFAYRDSTNNTIRTFVRKKKTQVEKDPVSKKIVKYKIKWLSDCEFKLTQVWTNDKKIKILNNGYWIYRITPLTEKSFSYSCTCANEKVITGVVVKMD